MAAYLVANVTVTDPGRFKEYADKVPATLEAYGGRYLIRSGAIHPLEGDLGLNRFIVIEFESMAAARRFYDSAEYAPLLKLRSEATVSQVAFVEAYTG